ncbi:MAG: helicase-related protein, partial [Chloroflexales bacterium]
PVDAAVLCATTLHAIIATLHRNPYGAIAAVGLHDARTAEDVRALLHRYDTTVTYVGTKASGTRITEALERAPAGREPAGSPSELTVRLLTGASPFGEIASTIDELESAPPWADPAHLDAVVATSVISHGVDIARLNLMIIDAIPGDMAEYVQASSRVGRRHLGLVVAVLPPSALRATSLYQRWREIHAHLDQLITPVAINRFARAALSRTFPGVMLSALYSRALREAGTTDLDTVYALRGPLAAALDLTTVTALAEAVYGLGVGRYPSSLEQQARQQITEQAALFVAALARLHATHGRYLRQAFSPAPMTSLRDVDVAVPFDVSAAVSERDLRWFRRPGRADEGEEDQG